MKSDDKSPDYTRLILEQHENKYVIRLWIGGIESKNKRVFDSPTQALREVCKITGGLRLPLCALSFSILEG